MSRLHAMTLLLFEVDYSEVPNVDFLVNAGDWVRGEPCFFEMSKHIAERDSQTIERFNHFLLPDFTTLDWWEAYLPPFSDVRNHMAEDAGPFEKKTPKMFWRGTVAMAAQLRQELVDKLGDQMEIADVKAINGVNDKANFKTIREICSYKYVIYTEGHTYSGRLKYQTLCNSVNMGMKFNYIEWWTHLLDPYYVVVDNWDQAIEKYRDMEEHAEKGEEIARKQTEVLRKHLSPRGIECYIQRLMTAYSRSINWEVLSTKVDVVGKVTIQDGENNEHEEEINTYEWLPIEQFVVKAFQKGSGAAPAWTKAD